MFQLLLQSISTLVDNMEVILMMLWYTCDLGLIATRLSSTKDGVMQYRQFGGGIVEWSAMDCQLKLIYGTARWFVYCQL
jgi:hypothetical protein